MFRRRNYQMGAYGTAYTKAVQAQAAKSGAQPTSSPIQNVPNPQPSQPVSGADSYQGYVQSGDWQNIGSNIKTGIINFGNSLLSALSNPAVLGASAGIASNLIPSTATYEPPPQLESDVSKLNEQLENMRAIQRAQQEEDPTGEKDYIGQNPLAAEMPHEYRANVQEGGRVGYAEGTTSPTEILAKAVRARTVARAIAGEPIAIASLIGGKIQKNIAEHPDKTFKERRAAIKKAKKEKKAAGKAARNKEDTDLWSPFIIDSESQEIIRGGMQEGGLMSREGYAVGGIASRLVRKLLKKHKKDPEVQSSIHQVKKEIDDIDDAIGSMGDEGKYADDIEGSFTKSEIRELESDREYLVGALEEIDEKGIPLDFDETGFPALDPFVSYTEMQRWEKLGKIPGPGDDDPITILPRQRIKKQEGGDIDEQMTALMGETEQMPAETMLPDEQLPALRGETEQMLEETMLPDVEMEENFVDYVVESALSPEDTNYLEEALATDERLSMIFDQVVETASEFSGSGPVEGPGTEVSDSIPARLSEGEFVMTAKAADQIGPDNLQGMMEQAETDADDVVRREMAIGGTFVTEDVDEDVRLPQQGVLDTSQREMLKLQLSANPRTQYRTVYG